jgi:hypothetical protein
MGISLANDTVEYSADKKTCLLGGCISHDKWFGCVVQEVAATPDVEGIRVRGDSPSDPVEMSVSRRGRLLQRLRQGRGKKSAMKKSHSCREIGVG